MKRSLLVEADGGPLTIVVAGANVRDDKLLAATLNAVVVERPKPTEEAAAVVRPLAEAGAIWWLETMWSAPNEPEDARARLRQGPPRAG